MMRDSAPLARHKLMHTATIVVVIVVFYGIVFTTPMLRHISVGVDTVQKLLVEREPSVEETPGDATAVKSDYIAPLWSCSDTDRKKKLVFAHIFKTAGSTMRSLLRSYAEECNAGYVTVINCGAVNLESLRPGNNWEKDDEFRSIQHGTDCKLKTTIFRNNTEFNQAGHEGPMNTTYLGEANVDIVSGHVAIGVDHEWKDDKGKHVDVQYLTFFRESTHKFVSAVLYLRPKLTFEEAVVQIKAAASQRVESGDYLSDIANLMTPVQREEFRKKNVTLTPEEGANLMIQNLKEQNILVGIVERMSESLEMLQHVVDKDGELDSLFESYGKIPPGANETKEIKANKSRLSSSEVLAEVEKDEEFMKVLHEFVKWDKKVYDFALDMHIRQYEAMKQRLPTLPVQKLSTEEKSIPEAKHANDTAVDTLSSVVDIEATAQEQIDETESDFSVSPVDPTKATKQKVKEAESLSLLPKQDEKAAVDDFYPEIEPMWSCSDTDRKTKLSFVHIFKTAGSSIRSLLRAYAKQCNAGLAIIVNCAPVDPDTIETGTWEKKPKFRSNLHGTACKLKNTVFRNNTYIQHSPGPGHDVPINTTYLEESKIDIIGGHITMGIDQFWKNDEGQHVDMQYFSFFRESRRKVVSAVVFMNPKISFDEAVQLVKDRVRKNVAHSVYLDNSNYIITPAQQAKYWNTTLSTEDRAKLVIQNMIENKFLVGIVERMSESLEMLQYLVDKDGELDTLFEKYGKVPPGTNKTKAVIENRSKLSSSEVLAEVEKDEEFMKEFGEYVKYDEMVYKFALEQHMRQYEAFERQTAPTNVVKTIEELQQLPTVEEKVKVVTNDTLQTQDAIDVTAELGDYVGKIDPLWRCKDTDRKKKLVFIHIFKTAGSSLRTLLRWYSKTCHAGLAIATGCAPVLPESVSGNWIQDTEKKPRCVLKQLVNRDNAVKQRDGPMNTTILGGSNTDILGGHITLGTEEGWKDDKGEHVDVQYFTFLREGKRMYVSAILYLHPELTFDEAVALLKSSVTRKVKGGTYLDVSRYLITPPQRQENRNSTLTTEQNAKLVMKNLKEKNVMVGIVERMSESLEMLQRLVDKDGEMDAMFESFGKIPPGTNKTKTVKANESNLSSGAVLAEVEKDEEFMKLFGEFVKYHDMIYQFSLDMHMRQYEAAFQREESITK